MDCTTCMPRKSWDLPFLAESEEAAALRRVLRTHLRLWGLHESIDAAQLCVSEFVANVINHVGPGTPTTLAVSMNGTYLRIEVHDPDTRALPILQQADADSETGRGMALVDAVADRWGVQLHPDRKVTWCELATGLTSPNGHAGGARVTRAEALLGSYTAATLPSESGTSRMRMRMAEETVIDVITDFLHWLRAHGRDADEALDRAQTHFEVQIEEVGRLPY
ncbi:ATP-binding protein [Streptomyces sp. NBC_00078]|uniref:ATP-binding protein n=1 Tax=unclassified Streptomyces TaxID=2593676 RepID=UPI0022588B6F|nr:ATP-binding protein [Streptomyces sp. NBC_00078]MCX5421097.1 ATP-binding protein [Streptomyces sp. NBC_00078]